MKAVAALVDQPLTSLIWLPKARDRRARGPARQDDRHRGHPLPGRLPDDDPRRRRPDHRRRRRRSTSGRACCRRSSAAAPTRCSAASATSRASTCQQRGEDPASSRSTGSAIPTYDELVLVANSDPDSRTTPRRSGSSSPRSQRGTQGGGRRSRRRRPRRSSRRATGLDPELTGAEIDTTLPLLLWRRSGASPTATWTRASGSASPSCFADNGLIGDLPEPDEMLTERPAAGLRRQARHWRGDGQLGAMAAACQCEPRAQRRALRRSPCASATSANEPARPRNGRIRSEELLDLLDGGAAAEPGEAADQLDVGEVAGRQRVGVAAAVRGRGTGSSRDRSRGSRAGGGRRPCRPGRPARRRPHGRSGSSPARAPAARSIAASSAGPARRSMRRRGRRAEPEAAPAPPAG